MAGEEEDEAVVATHEVFLDGRQRARHALGQRHQR